VHKKNIFYAQSGGVTAVINATACGVIETARQYSAQLGTVLAGKDGILGALQENLIDTAFEPDTLIAGLKYTPGGAFGSCRFKLKALQENREPYQRLLEVFDAHNIGYFFYNGGGDSQDTAHKVSIMAREMGYPLQCIGIPKTIDNDLPITDTCPGFGSVAKYVAISAREASLDIASMCTTSTKVFVLEVMGRHAGWIAAAGGLYSEAAETGPQIILFPEVPLKKSEFLQKVQQCVEHYGYCSIVTSEGIRNEQGEFLSKGNSIDAFGHAQLGGAAPVISQLIKQELDYKYHWAVSDYLQRSARHIASQVDVDQAYQLGCSAVTAALAGKSDIMLTIQRESQRPYQWSIGEVPLAEVANQEKMLPRDFISADGFFITEQCREYMLPLIQGEAYPLYSNGLPAYVTLNNNLVKKTLAAYRPSPQ